MENLTKYVERKPIYGRERSSAINDWFWEFYNFLNLINCRHHEQEGNKITI